MLRSQMLEAIFVAGSVLAGMAGSAVPWNRIPEFAPARTSFVYELVSGRQDLSRLLEKLGADAAGALQGWNDCPDR